MSFVFTTHFPHSLSEPILIMPIEVLEPKIKIGEPTINDFHQNSAIFNTKGINDSLAINEEIQEIPIESQMENEEDFFISNSCDTKIEEMMEGDYPVPKKKIPRRSYMKLLQMMPQSPVQGCQTKLEYDVAERTRLLMLRSKYQKEQAIEDRKQRERQAIENRKEQQKQAIKDRNEKRQKRRDEREKRRNEMEMKKTDSPSASSVGKLFSNMTCCMMLSHQT